MKQELRNLLELNDVEEEAFSSLLLETLTVGVFEIMVDRIVQRDERRIVLGQYRAGKDDLSVTRWLARHYVGAELPDETLSRIHTMLQAWLAKNDKRARIGKETKRNLLKQQGFRCAICGTAIDERTSHCDHIVAFKYVGDELRGNYQMLCPRCDHEKGASDYYELSRLLCNK